MLSAEDGNARANSNALILGITSGDAMPAASGHVTTREGDHFHFSQQIILSREGLAGGPADEQLFARQNFLCPTSGLSWLDWVF